ncbi:MULTISPECIES: HU family DNA-binding protein [Akkermansia]|uniref:HU family DNA-binding protein n=1 Tax=Akkermansia TaxID=239934 RepID=UPI001BFF6AE8|nr:MULTISPECIES: HU family DNA-binding protein [Akkermansia]MBT8778419.1 HU family DNA-binding protein [Akkermansia muciniphila]
MNKTEFIRELQRELGEGVTSRQAEQALNAVLDTIAKTVRKRSLVKFRGFGSFAVKHRRARVVRHPENGSKLFVHESSTMKFRPSSRLWKK